MDDKLSPLFNATEIKVKTLEDYEAQFQVRNAFFIFLNNSYII